MPASSDAIALAVSNVSSQSSVEQRVAARCLCLRTWTAHVLAIVSLCTLCVPYRRAVMFVVRRVSPLEVACLSAPCSCSSSNTSFL